MSDMGIGPHIWVQIDGLQQDLWPVFTEKIHDTSSLFKFQSLPFSQEWQPRRRPDWKKIMIPLARRLVQRNGIPLFLSPKA